MPLPVHIDHDYERWPWATIGLVAANVVVFVATLGVDRDAILPFMLRTDAFRIHQPITSAFLHVGVLHLVGNMLYLWVFGRYVEARLGPARLLVVYAACALGGDALFLLESVGTDAPRAALGASGAISGLMGFTLVAAPKADIRVFLVWWAHRDGSELPVLPAWFVLGFWIAWQLLLWTLAGPFLGTGFAAHMGGVLTGVGLAFWMHARATEGTWWHVERAPGGGSRAGGRRVRTAERWKQKAEERRAADRAREEAWREAERTGTRTEDDAIDWDLDKPPVAPVPEPPAPGKTPGATSAPSDDDAIDWPLSDTER